jgi:hypothetical protein
MTQQSETLLVEDMFGASYAPFPTDEEDEDVQGPDGQPLPYHRSPVQGPDGQPVSYAVAHAPAGGVTIGGKHFTGGQFIPGEVLAKATPEEKAKIEGDAPKFRGPPGGVQHLPGGALPPNPMVTTNPGGAWDQGPKTEHPPSPADQGPKGEPIPPPSSPPPPAALRTETLFHPHELQLPSKAKSSYNTPEQLLAAAHQTKPTFDRVLDTGEGVDAVLGAHAAHVNSAEDYLNAISQPGPVVVIGGIKGMKRAAEKVNADYNGDWTKLSDVIRGTVGVENIADVPKAVETVRNELVKRGWQLAQKPKNKFEQPTDAGYRDINLVFTTPDGMIGEIQINTKAMLRRKEEAHKFYEHARTIWSQAELEKRDLTPEEQAQYDHYNIQQKKIYDAAWQESLGQQPEDLSSYFQQSLGIRRADMPQIKDALKPQFLSELKSRGIAHQDETTDPATLKPSQGEYDLASFRRLQEGISGGGPLADKLRANRVAVSADDYVLDGHHRWLDAVTRGEPLNIVKINLPVREALAAAKEFADRMGVERRGVGGPISDGSPAVTDVQDSEGKSLKNRRVSLAASVPKKEPTGIEEKTANWLYGAGFPKKNIPREPREGERLVLAGRPQVGPYEFLNFEVGDLLHGKWVVTAAKPGIRRSGKWEQALTVRPATEEDVQSPGVRTAKEIADAEHRRVMDAMMSR